MLIKEAGKILSHRKYSENERSALHNKEKKVHNFWKKVSPVWGALGGATTGHQIASELQLQNPTKAKTIAGAAIGAVAGGALHYGLEKLRHGMEKRHIDKDKKRLIFEPKMRRIERRYGNGNDVQ